MELSPACRPASVSPDPLGAFVHPQQRWWYPALVAKKDLPTTIQTGTELAVLAEQDDKVVIIIECTQAADKV